jgi:hypothetical protein
MDKNKRIFKELEEVDEIIFICKGSYVIGYKINEQEKFILKFQESTVIGGFECAFDRRSLHIYKSSTKI